ncbi:MAG: phosphodiester glycosidase family protein [Spartobacteria bacterium]
MRNLSAPVAILFCATLPAVAEWQVESSTNEAAAAPAIIHRHVDLADASTGESAIVDLALFSTKSCKLRVIDNAGGANNLSDTMRRTNCVAGVNGGYFDPNFAPLGLRIVDGKTTAKLAHGRLMSGIFSSNGSIQLLRLAEFPRAKKVSAAVECGPFLVDLAKPVRGLEGTRGARRTFIAIGSGDRAALGSCSDVSLADLGRILATPLGDFKIQRALNLDGGSSSAFWFKRAEGSALSISEYKSVRDFVGIVPR